MIDWDLFVIPWFVLLLYIIVRTRSLIETKVLKSFLGPILGLCLLGFSFFITHAKSSYLLEHYSTIGKRSFKTYWIGSSTASIEAIEFYTQDSEIRKAKYIELVTELRPYAIEGNDKEFAALLLKIGRIEKDAGNLEEALNWMQEAYLLSLT